MKDNNSEKIVESHKVCEPVAAYVSSDADIITKLNAVNDEYSPCVYSDEEFVKEIALSEKEGFISHADFKKSSKEKWGVEL